MTKERQLWLMQLKASLDRMIDIGLPYLFMNRESSTLSGGEAQRLKLVRYMGSSLCGMIYIFDEPSTGMHPRDVHRMSRLLKICVIRAIPCLLLSTTGTLSALPMRLLI